MKYFIKTYGCQMNYSDSERIASVLELAGYQKALLENNADLIVINACSVRKSAVDRIAGNFKKYKRYKKINPRLRIVLTGCVLENDKKKFEKMFDLIMDIKEMKQLLAKSSKNCYCNDNYFQIKPLYQNKFSAYVPIMTGCDNFCSYCVVPYTRGREYSRLVEEIITEIEGLIEQGYKEIILLGQNVNSYQSETVDFPKLLKLISDIPCNFWIRFLTSHPKDMSEKLIRTVAECEKITPYFHLALQSGNNKILKKMNRKYTAEHFLELLKMIRKYIPNSAISTDIIVGFPSETENQFQDTAEIMKTAKFDLAYINKYSPRARTASAKLDDNVSWEEKKSREEILTEILKKTALENNRKYLGKIVEVLVDKADSNYISGKTKSFKRVKINVRSWKLDIKENSKQYGNTYYHTESLENLIGKIVNIKITQADAWGLEGEIVK